ncbi:hypothetical protein NBRC110019_31830 [Neptunitalea chrysea]|uniref:Uncharacterized protein n=1 Tax=Neptunitalea chrysea TaxID=1647581 RepID=A0A9W6EWM9_9FLAO|nr:hypothetical protein [Neptunitalea chrysea]GLB54142.1 hypothetical protein NBRC110019_31830 [Neptunitalea chrysea]
MNKELKDYEKGIDKKHRFGWAPSYSKEVMSNLPPAVFTTIVLEALENLEWEVVYTDEKCVEARRKNSMGKYTEDIRITYNHGKLLAKSTSVSGMWDLGVNSKRVLLLLHAINEVKKKYSADDLKKLAVEATKKNNWDDYIIPDTLPAPLLLKKPAFIPITIVAILSALALGLVVAFVCIKFIHFVIITELIVGIILSMIITILVKIFNYTQYQQLQKVFIATVIVTYIANIIFQVLILMMEFGSLSPSFMTLFKLKFEYGFTVESLELGSAGLVILWILQPVISYFSGINFMPKGIVDYIINRVPEAVLDFVYYHSLKDIPKNEIRVQLAKRGWTRTKDQDYAFEGVNTRILANIMNRIDS